MKIKINNSLEIETISTLSEIAESIIKNKIDLNENNNLIHWKNVWSVVVIKS